MEKNETIVVKKNETHLEEPVKNITQIKQIEVQPNKTVISPAKVIPAKNEKSEKSKKIEKMKEISKCSNKTGGDVPSIFKNQKIFYDTNGFDITEILIVGDE